MNNFRLTTLAIYCLIALTINSTPLLAEKTLTYLPDKPKAEDFILHDLEGKPFTLEDFKGEPIIVNFWATWCPPCREELPSMNRGWAKVKDEGIKMVAINAGDKERHITRFLKKQPIDFLILMDESNGLLDKWGGAGMPTTFIIDPQGHLIVRALGKFEWDSDELLDIARSLKTQKVSVQ